MRLAMIGFPALLLPAIVLLVSPAGCNEEGACGRPPAGWVTAFLEGDEPSGSFTASVVEAGIPASDGILKYRLREAEGSERVLDFRAPDTKLPVAVGETYDFSVETVPGMPTPCSLVIRDDEGILFAGASDYRPGVRVLENGLPGFTLSLEDGGCMDRNADSCFEEEVNRILRVDHADSTLRLYQGESGVLGGYRVRCLTSRRVVYSNQCADAGVFGVSYLLRRAE